MKWFKFYGQDWISDPKTLSLGASERSCWLTLLSYASINDNGMITFLSEEQLKIQAGIDPTSEEWDKSKGVLEKFKTLEMIRIDNGVITILNWRKRQETSLTAYERVKRYREKKRLDNENDNAKITLEENRIEKNRREEIKKENKESRFAPPSLEEVSNYCLERKNGINAQNFLDFYSSKGWLIGKNKMKDWRAAVRTWENRDKPKTNQVLNDKYAKFNS